LYQELNELNHHLYYEKLSLIFVLLINTQNITDSMAAPLKSAVNLTEKCAGNYNFGVHYSAQNAQNFGKDIVVDWLDLQDSVLNNNGINNFNPVLCLLKFIHRYDTTACEWFLTMEVCQADVNWNIVTKGNRFDLNTDGTICASNFKGDYDPDYFNNVLCGGNAINYQNFVNNLVFPWYLEIAEIHCQNGLPNDNTIYVVFTSCTYDYTGSGISNVQWPHIVLIYFGSTVAGDYLDDATYTNMFVCKAGDMATMCPPTCKAFLWPASLPATPVCLP
jgi:hypothetical protein